MKEQNDPVVRKTISMPSSLWRLVEDYRFEGRIRRESEAVQQLLRLGLEAAAQPRPCAGGGSDRDSSGGAA